LGSVSSSPFTVKSARSITSLAILDGFNNLRSSSSSSARSSNTSVSCAAESAVASAPNNVVAPLPASQAPLPFNKAAVPVSAATAMADYAVVIVAALHERVQAASEDDPLVGDWGSNNHANDSDMSSVHSSMAMSLETENNLLEFERVDSILARLFEVLVPWLHRGLDQASGGFFAELGERFDAHLRMNHDTTLGAFCSLVTSLFRLPKIHAHDYVLGESRSLFSHDDVLSLSAISQSQTSQVCNMCNEFVPGGANDISGSWQRSEDVITKYMEMQRTMLGMDFVERALWSYIDNEVLGFELLTRNQMAVTIGPKTLGPAASRMVLVACEPAVPTRFNLALFPTLTPCIIFMYPQVQGLVLSLLLPKQGIVCMALLSLTGRDVLTARNIMLRLVSGAWNVQVDWTTNLVREVLL